MRKNVGTFDAYLRITFGLVALGLGSSRRMGGLSSVLLTTMGAMKVAEGITRFCPTLWALGLSTRAKDIQREEQVIPGVVQVGNSPTEAREWAPGWTGTESAEPID